MTLAYGALRAQVKKARLDGQGMVEIGTQALEELLNLWFKERGLHWGQGGVWLMNHDESVVVVTLVRERNRFKALASRGVFGATTSLGPFTSHSIARKAVNKAVAKEGYFVRTYRK